MSEDSAPAPSGPKDGDPSSSFISRMRNLLFGRPSEGTLREVLEDMIGDSPEGQERIGEEERLLLLNTLDFAEKRVEDVMIPRADVVAVSETTSFADLVQIFASAEMSRLPVYRDSLDEVIGLVHVKDVFLKLAKARTADNLLKPETAGTLASIMRPVLFVPSSMRLADLLVKMRATRIHMAVVVDEYGGTDGLVTNEDLVEEIVGEIEDEHDTEVTDSLTVLDGQSWEAGARLPVEDLEDAVGATLLDEEEAEEIDTLGGLVVSLAGRVPLKGEIIHHDAGFAFEILDADPRRLKKVRIRRETVDVDQPHVTQE